jgi:CCR4-NOT transcriptional complex subunit CAF120
MSLWEANELDHVDGERDVIPTFINLTDAAIHMIPSMTLSDGKKLDNILSVSTAASNKYLFHFDSYHALTQWTASIRLAMYEHATLQEAYTGALIAGKGKSLNNIRVILDRQGAKYEDWVRVRFGAGTPWRRYWCVVSPPDQKEYAKLQKNQKKTNIYDRSSVVLKGDMKFYDTKKITKKTRPVATVQDAFSCYAIYPQSKPLIDQSTLVKIEGKIIVHSKPETVTEGFVFVMPESRPAVTGFEIMLQFLFPVFDTFNLYGRPKKLIADVLDTRGLMFAMPSDKRYGYLELWDVTGLINTDGSQTWSERHWRKQLKDLTSTRLNSGPDRERGMGPGGRRNTVSRAGTVNASRSNLRFQDSGSVHSQPSTRPTSPSRQPEFEPQKPRRVDSAPPANPFAAPRHQRSVSEHTINHQAVPSRLTRGQGVDDDDDDRPPTPPAHGVFIGTPQNGSSNNLEASDSDESPVHEPSSLPELPVAASAPPSGPVESPPSFAHASNQRPPIRPSVPSTMKPNPQVDSATLHQMADAGNTSLSGGVASAGAAAAWRSQESLHGRRNAENGTENGQQMYLNPGSRPSPTERHSGSRLPTIPASPYVEHAEFVQPPAGYEPVAPPVPEHGVPLHVQKSRETFRRSRPGSRDGSIQRKPVPGRSPSPSQRSTTSSSLGSLRNDVISPEALDALEDNKPPMFRQQSASSSCYDDDDAISTSTPDYASTHSEEIPPQRMPVTREYRPRNGVLRTVGGTGAQPQSGADDGILQSSSNSIPQADMPSIDFGPTYALGFDDKRPGTSGTMTQVMQNAGHSRSKDNLASSPNEQNRQSYISSGRTTPNTALHMRNTSAASIPASPQVSDSRSVAWQPVSASAQQHSDRPTIGADEWVMHRAAQSPGLVYGHGRTNTNTSPVVNRTRSGDWTHLQRTSEGPVSSGRRSPGRPLDRPQSRGAEHLLDQRQTSLSAREQEQVARMTNTPLLDLAGSHKRQQSAPQGLLGYIDFREKEKAAAKTNRHSMAMQSEIEKRMLQTQQRQMEQQQQQQMEQQRQMEMMQQQRMMEMQHMNQQMAMAQSNYAQSSYAPSMMGMPQGFGSPSGMASNYAPSMMGGQALGTPSGMASNYAPSMMGGQALGTPTGIAGMGFSTPSAMQMYSPQGYFAQPISPGMQIPGAWVPSPTQPMQSPGFPPQQQQQHSPSNPHYPPTRPYGADFDQAQAARHGQQQTQNRRS